MRKMNAKKLALSADTLRVLSAVEMRRAAGGIPTANVSAENASCCSFDAPCPSETCTIHSCNTRCADCF